jgi:serine/threonine protein phosphatase PrpC
MMMQIAADMSRREGLREKPSIPDGPWNLGLATRKGHVRSENQDYVLGFTMAGRQMLIVADGCGGLPNGQRAAYLAAVTAAESLILDCGAARQDLGLREAAARAVRSAWLRLATEGDKLNVSETQGGLRTTLVVVVGGSTEYGFAYIGDGGGEVLRASGQLDRFLVPQKAGAPNILACSLGPGLEGEPVTGSVTREPGDLLLVGSDGVFDRVDGSFARDLLRAAIQHGGDLQMVAARALDELADTQDEAGYICDDNLTIGLMAGGAAPRLASGFWEGALASPSPV